MTAAISTIDAPKPGFAQTFHSEWRKLTTLRSMHRNLILGVAFGIVLALGLAFITGATWDEWDEQARSDFNPILFPLTGGILTVIFFAVVGINAMSSEFSSGMIRTTLMATPHRTRVFLAKALVVAVLTTLAGLVVSLGMLLGSQPIYDHYNLQTADFWSADFARVALVGIITTPVIPILAMCLTVFTKTTASTLTIVLVTIFITPVIGSALPKWWQENVMIFIPGAAADSLAVGHLSNSDDYLSPAVAALITIAWLGGALFAAIRTFAKRDA